MNFNLAAQNTDALKQAELRQHLTSIMDAETERLAKITDAFCHLEKCQYADYVNICEEILAAADKILNAGDWQHSLFLRNTMKPVVQIKERALTLKHLLTSKQIDNQLIPHELKEGQLKLFVSLYQVEGQDLSKWINQLTTLASHMTGRPIYQNEEDVQKIIRAKLIQSTEAYIVVAVDKKFIIASTQMKPRQDRLGSTLVNVMEAKISTSNILEFVHMGKRYIFRNQQLILIG